MVHLGGYWRRIYPDDLHHPAYFLDSKDLLQGKIVLFARGRILFLTSGGFSQSYLLELLVALALPGPTAYPLPIEVWGAGVQVRLKY